MLRDEAQTALNEVLRQLRALAEYYRYAADHLHGPPAVFCRRQAQGRGRQADALAEDIRAMGDLPDGDEPESYLFAELAEWVRATLSGDASASHLRPRLEEERGLLTAIDEALNAPGLPPSVHDSLEALRRDALAAVAELERWLDG